MILAGSELFTGNCLMVMALLERRITPAQLLRNWLTVYLGQCHGAARRWPRWRSTATRHRFSAMDWRARWFPSRRARRRSEPETLSCAGSCAIFWSASRCGWQQPPSARRGRSSRSFSPSCSLSSAAMSIASRTCTTCPAGAFAAAEYGMETTLTLAGCLKNIAAVTLGNLVGGAALGVGYRFAYLKE